jgi:hypothetical protein
MLKVQALGQYGHTEVHAHIHIPGLYRHTTTVLRVIASLYPYFYFSVFQLLYIRACLFFGFFTAQLNQLIDKLDSLVHTRPGTAGGSLC